MIDLLEMNAARQQELQVYREDILGAYTSKDVHELPVWVHKDR